MYSVLVIIPGSNEIFRNAIDVHFIDGVRKFYDSSIAPVIFQQIVIFNYTKISHEFIKVNDEFR